MREPIAEPNTIKYSAVDITGEMMDCSAESPRHFKEINSFDCMNIHKLFNPSPNQQKYLPKSSAMSADRAKPTQQQTNL